MAAEAEAAREARAKVKLTILNLNSISISKTQLLGNIFKVFLLNFNFLCTFKYWKEPPEDSVSQQVPSPHMSRDGPRKDLLFLG